MITKDTRDPYNQDIYINNMTIVSYYIMNITYDNCRHRDP